MKKNFFHYLLELFIIVFGISVSFILNEWREGKKMDRTSISLLQQIHTDLAQDSANLEQRIQGIELLNEYAHYLLDPAKNQVLNDSLNVALLAQLNVMTFKPVTIGFSTLSQGENTQIQSNQKLLRRISQLYTNQFAIIEEYGEIDRSYVVQSVFPFYAKHFPFAPNFNFKTAFAQEPEPFMALTRDDEFLNIVQQNTLIKAAFHGNFVHTRDSIEAIMSAIEQEILAQQ